MLLRILAGLIVGFLWEMGAVNYTRAVMNRLRWQGVFITCGMGLLGLLPSAIMVYERHIDMAFAFIVGEALGTFIFIGPPIER